jgi:hypothetical protein
VVHPDFTPDELATYLASCAYTMTSPERVVSLIRAVEHVVRHRIPGDIVECGVWRGGSMMAVARTLLRLGAATRTLHLFDTYEGMPPPSHRDYNLVLEKTAAEILAVETRETSLTWGVAALDQVQAHMSSTGYPAQLLKYPKGRVEETVPGEAPDQIALLRLDTDWCESTRHELIHLFPRLVSGGVLIVDDYGHWRGVRQAVDEYLEEHRIPLLLGRIDYTGRIGVKP